MQTVDFVIHGHILAMFLKILKIASATDECNFITFKISRVAINHKMHKQVHIIIWVIKQARGQDGWILAKLFFLRVYGLRLPLSP